MTDDAHLNERIRDALAMMLTDEMAKHIPNDERVDINSGRMDWEPSDKTYVGVDHELPVLRGTFQRTSDAFELRLGLHGGVHLVTRRGGILTVGHWIDGTWTLEDQIHTEPS